MASADALAETDEREAIVRRRYRCRRITRRSASVAAESEIALVREACVGRLGEDGDISYVTRCHA